MRVRRERRHPPNRAGRARSSTDSSSVISALDERFIAAHAYVPEHLPGYVGAVSAVEAHWVDDFLCYHGADQIVFIGYPLGRAFDEPAMAASLQAAVARFAPQSVSVVAP